MKPDTKTAVANLVREARVVGWVWLLTLPDVEAPNGCLHPSFLIVRHPVAHPSPESGLSLGVVVSPDGPRKPIQGLGPNPHLKLGYPASLGLAGIVNGRLRLSPRRAGKNKGNRIRREYLQRSILPVDLWL